MCALRSRMEEPPGWISAKGPASSIYFDVYRSRISIGDLINTCYDLLPSE